MPSFEVLLTVLIVAAAALGAVILFAILRRPLPSPAMQAVGRGEFAAALAAAGTGPGAKRDELLAAAVASKHLLRLEESRALLERILAADPADGEAWLEAGLAAAYAGDYPAAERAFHEAAAKRSDLAESITLHRAWLEVKKGDLRRARLLFDEIETSLENKLRTDLGSGEPLFAEWFLQAAALWAAFGDAGRAAWALEEGKKSAPESRLPEILAPLH